VLTVIELFKCFAPDTFARGLYISLPP